MLLSAEHIDKDFGGRKLLSDVSLYLDEGDKLAIIGVNGTGKSTLLSILAGTLPPDAGAVSLGRNRKVSFLPQNPVLPEESTALSATLSGQREAFGEVRAYEAKSLLNRLGVPDWNARIETLSGGQKKRVALAAALLSPAEILILDEPTNHLDGDMVVWLEDALKKRSGALIMVTHDRYFLENAANRIAELDRGKLFFYEANYSHYLKLKAERTDMALASERKRQSVLRREYEWISRGARARSTKSRDRIERYQALKKQSAPEQGKSVQMVGAVSRMGKKCIELTDVSKSFGDKAVLSDFSHCFQRDDRVGLVGCNGAGKSTLLNLIAGKLPPDAGTVEVGQTVRFGYFQQENGALDPNKRVYDCLREVADSVETGEGTLSPAKLLERFLFDADAQFGPVKNLSGGEKRRLLLLCVLASAPNVLLFDEPTNDLDIETLTILEEYLSTFPGAVIAASHDRYFLDKIAHSILALPGDGSVTEYAGNYSDYLMRRPGPEKQAAETEREQKAPEPRERRPQQKMKMTFREQRDFSMIEGEIEALEARVLACKRAQEAAASDYEKLLSCTEALDALQEELSAKTERWLYLTELSERIEKQSAEP